jgi:hypothetical protein
MKNKQQVAHLLLYREDFITTDIWIQVCDTLRVNPDEGDTITVYWDIPADIKWTEEN